MNLTADYHTHTVYSHGKSTVMENAEMAKQQGLMQIGITDHGFAHSVFGLRKNKLDELRKDCQVVSEKTGVKVLMGVESNIIGTDGTVDLQKEYYDKFDLFLAGIHKLVLFKFNSYFPLGIPNLFNATFKIKNAPKSLIKTNTKTYINVIKKNPIDVITHLNFCAYSDSLEVAKCASDYGTYLELSGKKEHLTDEELSDIVLKTSAKFVINSDAHNFDRVGDIALALSQIKRVGVPLDRIMNVDGKLPSFRFKAYKEKSL